MTPSRSIFVGFARAVVELNSDDDDLVANLGGAFRHLRGTAAAGAPRLDVRRAGREFVGTGPAGTTVRRRTLREAVRWARQQVIELLVEGNPDLFWLHGAVAGRSGAALMLGGSRGRGKSTLVTALLACGWTFLTDDIVPLAPGAMQVLPFPRVPEVRADPGREMPASWLLDVAKAEIAVDDHLHPDPLRIRAIVFPHAARSGVVRFRDCTRSEAVVEIAEGCWNFAAHGVGGAETLSRLVSSAAVARLEFHDSVAAAAALTDWYDALPP